MKRAWSMIRLPLLVAAVLLASHSNARADLPPCETFCNCTSACYVDNCQVGGIPQSCGSWGICEFSCYCGGQC